MKRTTSTLTAALRVTLICLLSGLAAQAQTAFRSVLSDDQLGVPSGVTSGGEGLLLLDPISGRVRYEITLNGAAMSGATAALRRGAPGSDGAPLFAMQGGPAVFAGQSAPLSRADQALLRDGMTYVQIDSNSHPLGALRGQVAAAMDDFVLHADGAAALPPTSSFAATHGTLRINAQGKLVCSLSVTGLSSPAISATLRRGHADQDLGIIAAFTINVVGGITTVVGTSAVLSAADHAYVRSGHAWMTIATSAFPASAPGAGEIRGRLTPWQLPYGENCAPAGQSAPTLINLLPWEPNGLVDLYLVNDNFSLVPFQVGLLFVGQSATAATLAGGCSLLVDPADAIALPLMPPLHNIQAHLPAVLPQTWLHLQFVGANANGAILSSHAVAALLDP